MPTLQQLRYLVALADTLSFSRAAEITHVTQPTLSMQLKELETRLGARLVERTRARVFLTPVGAEIARRARTIAAEIEDVREIARRSDAAAAPAQLQVGVVHSVGAYVLSVAMPDLRRCFPHMRLLVREDRPEALARQLSEGVHDILLLADPPGGAEFDTLPLLREPLRVVLPFDHPLAGAERIAPGALAGQTVLTMDRGPRLDAQIRRLCRRAGAVLASDYEGTTLDTLRQMVASGMGISLLPALYVRSEVLREQLVVARPLAAAAPERELTLAWRRNSPRQAAYAALAGVLRTCLAPWGRPV